MGPLMSPQGHLLKLQKLGVILGADGEVVWQAIVLATPLLQPLLRLRSYHPNSAGCASGHSQECLH